MLWWSWRVGFFDDLGRALLTDQWHLHRLRRAALVVGRSCSAEVPPGRFVSAQDAHQRDASALEVEKRVVAAKAAQELPRAPRGTIHESSWGLCKGECAFLC
jgi:hypothetical protein